MPNKKCLLLLNVGTPDSPARKDVRKYLAAFLNDKYVIDLPWLVRKILVNGIIIPFRVRTSVKIYAQLWQKHGRILDTLTANLVKKLRQRMEKNTDVEYAMRYGNPSMESVMKKIAQRNYEELILLPLYPQKAMSTTETSEVEAFNLIEKYRVKAKVSSIPAFYEHPKYLEGILTQAKSFDVSSYDHVLFSYHGLPNRHLRKAHKQLNIRCKDVDNCSCKTAMSEKQKGCYKAECYETARKVATALQIPDEKYSVAFQSRLDNNWMRPFSDEQLTMLVKNGKKNILVFALSFTIDCLETLHEIGEEYTEDFYQNGGKRLDLVPCLNDSNAAVDLIESLVK